MFSDRKLPKTFWPEAVNWVIYILNICPTLAVKNMTPQEALSGVKPSVEHFIIFWSIAHDQVPDAKRTKLDDKSVTCVFLGVSEESKGYRLYDPTTKRIVVCRDVLFEEEGQWKWEQDHKNHISMELEWDENEIDSETDKGENEDENNSDNVGSRLEERLDARPSERRRQAPRWM